jgi:hypothetical protein
VTEMESRDADMDRLLRRSMNAPIPTLSPEFDQRVLNEVNRRTQTVDRFPRNLLLGYCLMSIGVCVLVMRGQGMNWAQLSAIILTPLSLLALLRIARLSLQRIDSL